MSYNEFSSKSSEIQSPEKGLDRVNESELLNTEPEFQGTAAEKMRYGDEMVSNLLERTLGQYDTKKDSIEAPESKNFWSAVEPGGVFYEIAGPDFKERFLEAHKNYQEQKEKAKAETLEAETPDELPEYSEIDGVTIYHKDAEGKRIDYSDCTDYHTLKMAFSEPEKLNQKMKLDAAGEVIYCTEPANCGAYAYLGFTKNPLTGERFSERPQPGELAIQKRYSGEEQKLMIEKNTQDRMMVWQKYDRNPEKIKEYFLPRIQADLDVIGKEMVEVSADYLPKTGERMFAFMTRPATQFRGSDYHFMLKCEDGQWSHKPGLAPPRNTEAESLYRKIENPEKENSGYPFFLGYYVARPKQ